MNMKLITSHGFGKDAIDDLYEQVLHELSAGADLYLGLIPFGTGIGQCVGGTNDANLEFQLIAEKDGDAFNQRLGDYLAHGWLPHMGPTPWYGFFIQWVCRERGMAVGVLAASAVRPLPRLVPQDQERVLPYEQNRALVVEDVPSLRMVERVQRVFVMDFDGVVRFPFGSVPSILPE